MSAPRDPYHVWLGLPPGQQPPNYYRLLGLREFENRPEVIDAAAERQTARLLTVPPEARGPEVQKLLAEIASARLCLLQPARKLAYDEALRQQAGGKAAGERGAEVEGLPRMLAPPAPAGMQAQRKGRWQRWLAGVAAIIALALAAWLIVPGSAPPEAEGTLVIDFPETLRASAAVRIDGQLRDIPPLGPVEYRCRAGEHELEVHVPGGPEWKRSISIAAGRKHLVSLPWEEVASRRSDRARGGTPPPGVPLAQVEARLAASSTSASGTSTAGPAASARAQGSASDGPVMGPPAGKSTPSRGRASETLSPADREPPGAEALSVAPVGPEGIGADRSSQAVAERPNLRGDKSQAPGAGDLRGKSPAPSPPATLAALPVPVLDEFDRPLAEAWSIIQGADVRQGYEQLLALWKKDRGDFRVAFSLGLLEALLGHNWAEAEKRFAQCQRLVPDHPAALNNLALVRLRIGQEHLALRHWEAMLAANPAPPEVVHNLRRCQALVRSGVLRFSPSRLKVLDELAARAAPEGSPLRPNVGFLYLPLKLPGEQTIGWPRPRSYHDRWCMMCNGRGVVRCPEPDCARGTVRASAPRLLYVDPLTRTRVMPSVPVRTACRVCKGEGWIDCKRCEAGIDPTLKDVQDPLAKSLPSNN